MLNLSKTSVKKAVEQEGSVALESLQNKRGHSLFKVLGMLLIVGLVVLFLPWTQSIQAPGKLTSLDPSLRPQTIHSIIGGRIERWYVHEGQNLKKGDTIAYISEIKDEYFDSSLLRRAGDQITSKESAVRSYMDKVKALDVQIDAMNATLRIKLEQLRNKVNQARLAISSDSAALAASEAQLSVADAQLKRAQNLHKQGLLSLTELEARRLKFQDAQARYTSADNKLQYARNELSNSRMEINSTEAEYRDKISKAESEKYATMSMLFEAEAAVTKLQNQYANYSIRLGLYFITAPQNCIVTKVLKPGLGQTIKEGEALVSIMPAEFSLAVEWFVEPIDLPLLSIGQKVRFVFDGWPAFVFSGWPDLTFGTYGGKIVAIDYFTGARGKYRILVAPDSNEKNWPYLLRAGSGAQGIALLNEVPVWYELWRRFNGFPPDFYQQWNSNPKEK